MPCVSVLNLVHVTLSFSWITSVFVRAEFLMFNSLVSRKKKKKDLKKSCIPAGIDGICFSFSPLWCHNFWSLFTARFIHHWDDITPWQQNHVLVLYEYWTGIWNDQHCCSGCKGQIKLDLKIFNFLLMLLISVSQKVTNRHNPSH